MDRWKTRTRRRESLRQTGFGGRRWKAQRRECSDDRRPLRLQPWWQHERLPEVRGVLVHRESRSLGRELEEDAARLEEVNRFEPEPIDWRRRSAAGLVYLRAKMILCAALRARRCRCHRTPPRRAAGLPKSTKPEGRPALRAMPPAPLAKR